jgi:hypothetical protein
LEAFFINGLVASVLAGFMFVILDDGRTYVVDLKRIKRVFATILEAFFINGLVASVLAGFMFVIYVIYVIFVCARAAYRRWWM